MADTQRTLAACLTLLADNTTGDISPQDLRDTVVSTFDNFGVIGVSGGSTAQTTNATPGTFDTVTGMTTDGADEGCVTADVANNRLTLTVNGFYLCVFMCSFSGTNSATINCRIALDGSKVGFAEFQRKLSTSGDVGSAMCLGIANVTSASQQLTAEVTSDGGSDSFTPVEASLMALKIG